MSGSTTTWYGTDALGSVRLTMTNTGLPLDSFSYDPWGTPEGTAPPTFGFTGELQDASTGLVNLRARWYQPTSGRFGSRDPFAGFGRQPYSLHSYQYGYSNPVFNTDPTGECIPEDVPGLGEEDCHWIFETGSEPNWEDWRAYWNGPAGQIGYAIAGYLAWPVAVGFGIANLYQSSRIYIQDPTTGNFLWMAVDAALFYCGARAAGGPTASFRFAPQGAGAAVSVSNGAWAAKAVRAGVPTRMLIQTQPPSGGSGGGPPKASFGRATSNDYKETFFKKFPHLRGKVWVHHAVEQQVLKRFPGLVTPSEINSLENLRGIPSGVNSDIHLSKIRKIWNNFYRTVAHPTKQQLLDQATDIDDLFGHQFQPRIR